MEFYSKTADESFSIDDSDWEDAGPTRYADIEVDGYELSVCLEEEYLHVGTEEKREGPFIKVIEPSLGEQTHFSEDYDHHEESIIFWAQ